MSTKDDAISQEMLSTINANFARALSAPPDPGSGPPVAIHRIIYRRARVSDLPVGTSTSVSVYDEIRRSRVELGELVSARDVDHLFLWLVCGREGDSEVWRIVEMDFRSQEVVILTYSSDGDRARVDATRYAADATEVDLTSDFNPGAHFFGERRLPRSPGSGASRALEVP